MRALLRSRLGSSHPVAPELARVPRAHREDASVGGPAWTGKVAVEGHRKGGQGFAGRVQHRCVIEELLRGEDRHQNPALVIHRAVAKRGGRQVIALREEERFTFATGHRNTKQTYGGLAYALDVQIPARGIERCVGTVRYGV